MSTATTSKTQLRRQLRERRLALGDSRQAAAALAVVPFLAGLPGWDNARRIAIYLAADGELDPQAIARHCRTRDQLLYLPLITPLRYLDFALWDEDEALVENRFGIPEPPPGAARCPAAELDMVLLPLVGWSADGARLGMGGGFYDRSLARVSGPLLVGLAHSCQQVVALPQDPWDVKLDFVVTETGLHRCSDARKN